MRLRLSLSPSLSLSLFSLVLCLSLLPLSSLDHYFITWWMCSRCCHNTYTFPLWDERQTGAIYFSRLNIDHQDCPERQVSGVRNECQAADTSRSWVGRGLVCSCCEVLPPCQTHKAWDPSCPLTHATLWTQKIILFIILLILFLRRLSWLLPKYIVIEVWTSSWFYIWFYSITVVLYSNCLPPIKQLIL